MSVTMSSLFELTTNVLAAWRVDHSSAVDEYREQIAIAAQGRLKREWPSLGAALEQLEQLEPPAYLAGTVVDADTRRELIEALERMYVRSRASGIDESAAVRSILERAL